MYKTYQEAKVAHPDNDIYSNYEETVFSIELGAEYSHLTHTAWYCMNVKDFLASGHKFVEGDITLRANGEVIMLSTEGAEAWNNPSPSDRSKYVLKAKALESKTRIKVEYVLAEFNSDKERAEAFLKGNLYRYSSGEATGSVEEGTYPLEKLADMFIGVGIFRRIETEVSEKDEYLDWFDATRKELGPEKFAELLYDSGYRVIE